MPAETYTARPTIQIDSQQHALVNELALSFQMAEQEGGLSSLELRLSNVASDVRGSADLAFEDDEILKLGAKIALFAGDESSPTEIFRGTISALELEIEQDQPPELVVLAEDLFQQARLERRTQTYTETTVADLASNFASQLGLTPVITAFQESVGVQVQLNESDLAFMRRVLARYDGDMQIVGDELHISPRSEVQRGA
ncbi:MAG: phage late control D family protein, partial [Caldilineaceae bacterium]|nr:phage late control D family protein [Caldilineaceae bacterium]